MCTYFKTEAEDHSIGKILSEKNIYKKNNKYIYIINIINK